MANVGCSDHGRNAAWLASCPRGAYLSPMYSTVLSVHNIVRWLVILTGVVALVRCYRGLLTGAAWTPRERASLSAYANLLGLQFLVGLLLYVWLSPIPRMAFRDMAAAMGNRDLRFFVVEHPVAMILAMVLAQVAVARARKAATDAARFRIAAVLITISLVLVFVMIPWDRRMIPSF